MTLPCYFCNSKVGRCGVPECGTVGGQRTAACKIMETIKWTPEGLLPDVLVDEEGGVYVHFNGYKTRPGKIIAEIWRIWVLLTIASAAVALIATWLGMAAPWSWLVPFSATVLFALGVHADSSQHHAWVISKIMERLPIKFYEKEAGGIPLIEGWAGGREA